MAKLRDEMEARASLSGLDPDKIRKFRHIKRFSVLLRDAVLVGDSSQLVGVIGKVELRNESGATLIDCDMAPDQTEKDEVVTLLAAIHLGFRDLFPKFKGQITPAMIEKRAKELDAENHPAPIDPTKEVK